MPGWRWGWGAQPELREGFLAMYGPLSLLGLVTWVVLLVAGWAAVWWGLRSAVTGVDGYLDAVYFAGVGFFTVGFGDLVPTGGLARLLVLVEAFMGLVTMALVIGYLPTLYGAYSRREVVCPLTTWTRRPRRSGSWRTATPAGAARRWRRRSPSGSGGATRCSTATPPTRCWPCSAPASRARTG